MHLCGFDVFGNVKLLDYAAADEETDKKIYHKDGIALQMNKMNKKIIKYQQIENGMVMVIH